MLPGMLPSLSRACMALHPCHCACASVNVQVRVCFHRYACAAGCCRRGEW